jgi:hypothetical protein
MKQYECKVIFLDRIELGEENSQALAALNALGAQGWHVIHIREDVRNGRSLAFFLERERPPIAAAEASLTATGSAPASLRPMPANHKYPTPA